MASVLLLHGKIEQAQQHPRTKVAIDSAEDICKTQRGPNQTKPNAITTSPHRNQNTRRPTHRLNPKRGSRCVPGVSTWFTPFACCPGSLELFKPCSGRLEDYIQLRFQQAEFFVRQCSMRLCRWSPFPAPYKWVVYLLRTPYVYPLH